MTTEQYLKKENDERKTKWFAEICPIEFQKPIDWALVKNPDSFERISHWNGDFKGYCCTGPTNGGKTRAVWQGLHRLCFEEQFAFKYFTARGMMEKYFRAHMDGEPSQFWSFMGSAYGFSSLYRPVPVFLDDLDKVEMNERNTGVLFEFFDRVYRDHIPCISTTNKDRSWWTGKMGEAFVRRFMDDAQTEVKF